MFCCNIGNQFSRSPARLRRFFGVSRKSKKKRLLEVTDIAVVIFDIDLHDDQPQTAIGDPGWYMLVPMSTIAKVQILKKERVIQFKLRI